MQAEGCHYEDLDPGRRFRTGSRMITGDDIVAFARVSGDRNPLHLDDDYARASVFGGRVAHGVLGLAVATGLLNEAGVTRGTLVAFLGLEWSFVAPIRPGTEVHVELEVTSRRVTSKPGRGLVVFGTRLRDGDGGLLQEGELRMLVRRRD